MINWLDFTRVGIFYNPHYIAKYRKTPLLVSGVDPFSNANIYALDQLIAETKTDLESTTCPLLSPILQ
jgi:hypothetical protein